MVSADRPVAMFDSVPPQPDLEAAGASVSLRPLAQIMPSTWEGDIDPDRRRTILEFHPVPPELPSDRAVWSGVFVPVVFGTDTHIPG